jgi:hypothetical protein
MVSISNTLVSDCWTRQLRKGISIGESFQKRVAPFQPAPGVIDNNSPSFSKTIIITAN